MFMWIIGVLVSAETIAVTNENMCYNIGSYSFFTRKKIKHIHNTDHISK